ncbi:Unknown protein, partial [Striga hermonthica]
KFSTSLASRVPSNVFGSRIRTFDGNWRCSSSTLAPTHFSRATWSMIFLTLDSTTSDSSMNSSRVESIRPSTNSGSDSTEFTIASTFLL